MMSSCRSEVGGEEEKRCGVTVHRGTANHCPAGGPGGAGPPAGTPFWRCTRAEIRFVTELGVEVFVPIDGSGAREIRRAVFRALREYGGIGWRAISIPPGGLRFPLASEADFDWRLLGARRGTCTIENEEREGVWHAGQFYTRREFEANPRMKLGHAVKYSRGAKNGDPPEVVEEGDGSFKYVTLAVFRGDGKRREEYAVPAQEANRSAAPRSTAPTTSGRR